MCIKFKNYDWPFYIHFILQLIYLRSAEFRNSLKKQFEQNFVCFWIQRGLHTNFQFKRQRRGQRQRQKWISIHETEKLSKFVSTFSFCLCLQFQFIPNSSHPRIASKYIPNHICWIFCWIVIRKKSNNK